MHIINDIPLYDERGRSICVVEEDDTINISIGSTYSDVESCANSYAFSFAEEKSIRMEM